MNPIQFEYTSFVVEPCLPSPAVVGWVHLSFSKLGQSSPPSHCTPHKKKSHNVSVSSTAHDYKYLLYCRAVSSLSCCLLVSSSVSVLSKSTFSLHLTEDIHKGHTVSITVHSWLYIPLMLQSCVLSLLLSSGELSCNLINLLLNQSAPITRMEDVMTECTWSSTTAHCHSINSTKYLIHCRALSSLSSCCLVTSAVIIVNSSTFCSMSLHPTQEKCHTG